MKKISCIFAVLFAFFALQTAMAQSAETLYREGKDLYDKKDYANALPKLKAAADKGHKKAQYRMGRAYDKGNGVAEDNVKAYQWYLKSAAQGYAKAQYQLGRCYKKGKGCQQDNQKAFTYFMKAAKQENGDAELAVAKCYLEQGDTAMAKKWAKRAITNEKDGKDVLARLKEEAARGEKKDVEIMKLLGY